MKLSRMFFGSEFWIEPREFSRAEAWIYVIGRAAYQEREDGLQGQEVDVTRGQFASSANDLAAEWRWTRSRVRRFLEDLVKHGRITVKPNGRAGTLITVTNYDVYQDAPGENKPKKKKASGLGVDPEVEDMWSEWIDAFGFKRYRLTPERVAKLTLLRDECLRLDDDPQGLLLAIIAAVKASEHHMSVPAYHSPESVFRNAERRESWTQKGINLRDSIQAQHTVGFKLEDMPGWGGAHAADAGVSAGLVPTSSEERARLLAIYNTLPPEEQSKIEASVKRTCEMMGALADKAACFYEHMKHRESQCETPVQ
jgi:hypothetical protein